MRWGSATIRDLLLEIRTETKCVISVMPWEMRQDKQHLGGHGISEDTDTLFRFFFGEKSRFRLRIWAESRFAFSGIVTAPRTVQRLPAPGDHAWLQLCGNYTRPFGRRRKRQNQRCFIRISVRSPQHERTILWAGFLSAHGWDLFSWAQLMPKHIAGQNGESKAAPREGRIDSGRSHVWERWGTALAIWVQRSLHDMNKQEKDGSVAAVVMIVCSGEKQSAQGPPSLSSLSLRGKGFKL